MPALGTRLYRAGFAGPARHGCDMVPTFARPLRPTTLTWRIGTSGTPCACLCVARQRAGTVGTLFRCIAMLTKPFLQVFCMVGSSFGAWLAATSTAWWICTCGTPCACLCVLRQGAATVHTFSLTAMAAVRRVSAALAIALHCALSAALAAAVRLGACIVAPVMVGYLL